MFKRGQKVSVYFRGGEVSHDGYIVAILGLGKGTRYRVLYYSRGERYTVEVPAERLRTI